MADKRKFRRVKVPFPVECNLLPKQQRYFSTVSKDLSLGGVKILSDFFLPRGNFIKMTINLVDRVVDVKAKVAWCNKERVSYRYSVGLEFVEINEPKRKTLSTFLDTVLS